jgi:hypothetical protein
MLPQLVGYLPAVELHALLLFVWFQIVRRMPQDEEKGYGDCERAESRRYDQTEVVEGKAPP